MTLMYRFRRLGELARWVLVMGLALTPACSRPGGGRDQDSQTQVQPQAPFHDGDPASSVSLTPTPTPQNGDKSGADLPFRDSETLPAGTLLTVRLKSPIIADNPPAGSTFDAIVVEPVSVEGNVLIPQGADVVGRIESVHASEVKRSRSSVRLTLDSIDISGKDWPIQTASLFARGRSMDGDSAAITLEKGHRLTFRLAESVNFATKPAVLNR